MRLDWGDSSNIIFTHNSEACLSIDTRAGLMVIFEASLGHRYSVASSFLHQINDSGAKDSIPLFQLSQQLHQPFHTTF